MKQSRVLFPLFVFIVVCVLVAQAYVMSYALPVRDLGAYWVAAHLIRKNPYSYQLVEQFYRQAFRSNGKAIPMVITNTPLAIVLLMPLSMFSYHMIFALWTLFNILIVSGCAFVFWRSLHTAPSLAPALLSLVFGPTEVLLTHGQFSGLVLLGITLFLVMIEKRRDNLAGLSLLLVFLKPHIAAVFLLAVLLWTIQSKRWAILISASMAVLACALAPLALNSHIYAEYFEFSRSFAQKTVYYPNLGGLIYSLSGNRTAAYLPQIAGVIWFAIYWRKHRFNWNWKTHGMVVLLVSLASTYYSFPYDGVIALPALIAAYAAGEVAIFLVCFIVTDACFALYLSNSMRFTSSDYMVLWWVPCGFLMMYILSLKIKLGKRRRLNESLPQ